MKVKRTWFDLAPSASLSGSAIRLALKLYGRVVELPLEIEVALNWASRPSHAYCTYHAADLARRLGIQRISVIKFGVAGGNGLLFLKELVPRVRETLGIDVEVYGFDSGPGLPELGEVADLPYWFRPSQYRMDLARLKARLHRTQLVVGNVADTVPNFFQKYNPAPIGAIFNDSDLYTSTRNSLTLFDHDSRHFLPRVFTYFDDLIASELEIYGQCNGQFLAIPAFNHRQDEVSIGLNQNLLVRNHVSYRYQIYYTRLRAHPLYRKYIGGESQERIELALRLSEG